MLGRLLYFLTGLAFKCFNPQLALAKNARIDPRAFVSRGGRVAIGQDSIVRAGAMLLPSGGKIEIGERTSLNQYVVINGEGGVRIGNDVMIAAFVSIFAANHHYERADVLIRRQGMFSKGGIDIGNDVWIGTHAVILDGVKIATGCVVAAGAVVTKDTEPYSIVVGVPARVLGHREFQSE